MNICNPNNLVQRKKNLLKNLNNILETIERKLGKENILDLEVIHIKLEYQEQRFKFYCNTLLQNL